MSKCLYFCPSCRSFFSGESSVLTQRCDNCHTVLLIAHHDYDQYSSLPLDEKRAFQKDFLAAHPAGSNPSAAQPAGSDTWVSILRASCWFVVIISILVAIGLIFTGQHLLVSLIAGAVIVIIAFASVSALMVFCAMADDLRAIRTHLDRPHHH